MGIFLCAAFSVFNFHKKFISKLLMSLSAFSMFSVASARLSVLAKP